MARRITNNTGDWNYHQQYSSHPNVHQQYGQQCNVPTAHMTAPPKSSADPWNWGWEDSNGGGGGGGEPSNNNSQKDPAWDWSVESSSGASQETRNNGPNYGPPNSTHQIWPGNYQQQFPPQQFTSQVTNVHDVINDSFNSLSIVNQHPFGYGQQTLFNSTEAKKDASEAKKDTLQPLKGDHQGILQNSNQMRDQYLQFSANQNQPYFSGFHSPERVVHSQQGTNEGFNHFSSDNRTSEKKSSPVPGVGGSFREFQKSAVGESVDVGRDLQNKNASQGTNVHELSHRGESSTEALSPQWSTESLPSQGSDEISLTTDSSIRHSDNSNTPGDASTASYVGAGLGHESSESPCKSDQDQGLDQASNENKEFGSLENSIQSFPAPQHFHSSGGQPNKESSIPFFNTVQPSVNMNSPISTNSIGQIPGMQPLENPVDGAGILFSKIDKVSSDMEFLKINSHQTDVENVEIAPPESLEQDKPATSGAPISSTLPPPPPTSSRNPEKGANPYAAKGSSLNHKNASKSAGRSRGGVHSPLLGSEPNIDSKSSARSTLPATKTNKIPVDGEMLPAGSSKNPILTSTVALGLANAISPVRKPLSSGTEESVNLETVPDNKERPDVDLQLDRKSVSPSGHSRFNQTPVGQEFSLPDNQEVYLDSPASNLPEQTPNDNFPIDDNLVRSHNWSRPPGVNENEDPCNTIHSELDRVVPGQGEENPQSNNSAIAQNFGSSIPNASIEDITRRQVPGHQDTMPMVVSLSGNSNTFEDISSRAVPGGPVPGDMQLSGGMYIHRSVPGQTGGGSLLPLTVSGHISSGQGEDDTPPPGLSRMVPGESRGPEGQGGDDATIEDTPDEPRVVTGLADVHQTVGAVGTNSGSFHPLPDEPRVVTGVAQEELDNSLGQLTSPISSASMPSEGNEIVDLDADGRGSITEPTQLPSERSETIGSDCVETFPPVSSDTISRRDTDNQRRNPDDIDAGSVDLNRHGSSRDYFNPMVPRERDGSVDHSSEGRRFRDDRDSRHYERDDHVYDREQDSSPRGRYGYNRDRSRYDEPEYGPNRSYDERQGRRYKRMDDDDLHKDVYPNESEQKRKRERPTDRREHEEFARYYNRKPREHSDFRDYRDREGETERDHDRNRDRDRDRDRDRERDVDRERIRDREKDRNVDRDKERERDRYYDRRYPYDRDYRRHDEYYGPYEDYYGSRSRPSSRSGSRPEFDDERRRDYHQYAGYYYNPRAYYDEYNYRYLLAWQRYMQQHPQYQQQQQLHQRQHQQLASHVSAHSTSMPEDRGSVHSGRSSAHEELSRHSMERYRHPQYVPPYDYYYQQRSSSLTGDYDNNRTREHNVSMMEETTTSTTPQRLTPAKFATAHIKGFFAGNGQFIKILPHYPLDGQSATVEVHDLSQMLVPDSDLVSFPGPLIKGVTHKKSLMNFCTRKINAAEHDPNIMERDSVVLLWRLLLLLLRQNGMVVGTDIAELLLSSSPTREISKSSNLNTTLPISTTPSVRSVSPASVSGAECEINPGAKSANSKALGEDELANTFREYLLYGNTHEALEWAMEYGLWGHALFLASKLGSRTYANVMTRFANGLTFNDPLQTLYQLMSGRLPAAVTRCADEKWGDWKPHLAMILSNSSVQPDLEHRAIITLGDTLASRGCLYAAHFCYLMAQLEFGLYNQKSSKLVLIGSSHSKPFNIFANNEAIQMTEIYIYACQLADPAFEVPQFQVYKLLYAKRLVEAGMTKEALQYVEVIARTVCNRPSVYSLDFMQHVFDLGNRLKVYDVAYTSDAGETEELPWLLHLRNVLEDYMAGAIQPDGPSFGSTSNLSVSEGDSGQPQLSSISQQEQHQEQMQSEHQQPFSQHQTFSNQLQDQQQHQQQELQPQRINESENQMKYGETSQVSLEPINSTEPGGLFVDQAGWSSQDYQGNQNPESDRMQKNDQNWSQNNWNNGIPIDNSNSMTLQDNNQQAKGWHLQNFSDRTDQGSTHGSKMTGGEFGFYHPQTEHKQHTEKSSGEHQSSLATSQPTHKSKSASVGKQKKEIPKNQVSVPAHNSGGWFGGLWNKLSLRPKNQMILPDDKEPKIVWNSEKQKWVNTDGDEDEVAGDLPPPPRMGGVASAVPQLQSSSTSNGDVKMPPPLPGQNMYKMNRSRGSRANYVDVFGGVKNTAPTVAAPEIFPPVPTNQANPPANFFIPAPVHSDDNTPVDFLTAATEGGGGGGGGESSELSRWSSTSSVSKEVQSYMAPQVERDTHKQQRTQQTYGAPLMFNPSEVSHIGLSNSASLSKKRYPN